MLFRPSALVADPSVDQLAASGVHALGVPFLHRLEDPDVDAKTIGKVKECLNRIVVEISHNPNTSVEEVLPFVYAIVTPFVGEGNAGVDWADDAYDSGGSNEEEATALTVTQMGRNRPGHKVSYLDVGV